MRPRYPLFYYLFWVGIPAALLLFAACTRTYVLLFAILVPLGRLVTAGLNGLIPQPLWLGGIRVQPNPDADFLRGCVILGTLLFDATLFCLLIHSALAAS